MEVTVNGHLFDLETDEFDHYHADHLYKAIENSPSFQATKYVPVPEPDPMEGLTWRQRRAVRAIWRAFDEDRSAVADALGYSDWEY